VGAMRYAEGDVIRRRNQCSRSSHMPSFIYLPGFLSPFTYGFALC